MLRLPLRRGGLRALDLPALAFSARWSSASASASASASTYTPPANVLDELEHRGFVAATTSPELRTHLTQPSCVYAGVDPSASSLHVGNLLPLLGLLHFRARGHQAVALVSKEGAKGCDCGCCLVAFALSLR
jgi:tyrosyl-tRNA synthetase